ncbi:MAG TPA: tyrosine-type recombinase/integrase [Solirubrobacteraceae bacterium]|nr:tyrosine-type recombinase/integrase [Solirubrobacteraceae bacterium]
MAATSELPPGIKPRRWTRVDGTVTETYTVRFKDETGKQRRRTFDTVDDALDFHAQRRSAKRWRPHELRQEQLGKQTLAEFFATWWTRYGIVELERSTLSTYRSVWEAHAEPRLGHLPLGAIDPEVVVTFRGELIEAGVGKHSIVKTMSLLQRVFGDAVETGAALYNPFKSVRKPTPEPPRAVRPFTPLQVEMLVADISARGYAQSAALVRLMAYTGLRPQEALALRWYAFGGTTLHVEDANADGELKPLKNRRKARKRGRSIDLIAPVREDLDAWFDVCGAPGMGELIFPHETYGGPWLSEHYRTWRRRVYVPSAENVELHTKKPYNCRHTWASLRIAEKRLSVAEIAEEIGDKTSTVLDTYTHVIREWRGRRAIDIEKEVRRARVKVG